MPALLCMVICPFCIIAARLCTALHGDLNKLHVPAPTFYVRVEGGIFLPYPGPFPPSASLQLYVLTNNNTYLPYTWQNAVTNLIAPPAYPHPPVPPSSTSAMHHTAPTQPILPVTVQVRELIRVDARAVVPCRSSEIKRISQRTRMLEAD
ncbi:hypothetical protein BKA70DRAFT_1240162 [Coprinopsis sp. MPI-PUGE-AT-0042]|nr:hypothetical protein BKA70DRAFT_1240162 [Coprinopsis sp. MPI-PUGE-AT-0042]